MNINFGCGLSVSADWTNFDASPTLRVQRVPVLGSIAQVSMKPRFPDLANYGDIVKGLPVSSAVADLAYCSHVLEHLALHDLRSALVEVLRVLKPGGVFRGVLPDLYVEIQKYLHDEDTNACSEFMRSTSLGAEKRPKGLLGHMRAIIGNSTHLWMWDFKGLAAELVKAGFVDVRRAEFGDSQFPAFKSVELADRWSGCLGFQCRKSLQAQ